MLGYLFSYALPLSVLRCTVPVSPFFSWLAICLKSVAYFLPMLPEIFRDFPDVAYIFRDFCGANINWFSSALHCNNHLTPAVPLFGKTTKLSIDRADPRKYSILFMPLISFYFPFNCSWGSSDRSYSTNLFVCAYNHLAVVYCWNTSSSILRRHRWLQLCNT
jgi:hypothetical protein